MAAIVYSPRSLTSIERILQVLRDENAAAARASAAAIRGAVDHLALHPLIGRRIDGEIRELIISYGRTGYIALYRFLVLKDEVRVLSLRH